jgi:hypothetical protein
MLKKIFLLAVLITNLFKKLTIGLTLFLYNRTLGSKWGVIIGVAGLALLLLVTTIVFMPKNMASDQPAQRQVSKSRVIIEKEFTVEQSFDEESSDIQNLDALIAEATADPVETIEENLQGAEAAISFQATEFGIGGAGRPEPFMPSYRQLDPNNPPVSIHSGPTSDVDLAAQEAEQRRNEIRDALHNDVLIKGIVLDADHSNPMAILETFSPSGQTETNTYKVGDRVDLAIGNAQIVSIATEDVVLTIDDVTVNKRLPEFSEDAGVVPVSDTAGEDSGLMPPPVAPGGTQQNVAQGKQAPNDGTSINEAKKKIEEIDQLLDSF